MAKAGLVGGDVITSLDGHSVTSPAALSRLMITYHPGDHVRIGWLSAVRPGPHQHRHPGQRPARVGAAGSALNVPLVTLGGYQRHIPCPPRSRPPDGP